MKRTKTKPGAAVTYLIFDPLEDSPYRKELKARRAKKKARKELFEDNVVLHETHKLFTYATKKERVYVMSLTDKEIEELSAFCTVLFDKEPMTMLIEPLDDEVCF